MEVSYFSIALDDYDSMKVLLDSKRYNHAIVFCNYACEKFLKSIIEITASNCEYLLQSKDLRKLFDEVKEVINLSEDVICYLELLSNFNINVLYPGETNMQVTEKDLNMAIKVTEQMYTEVYKWHLERAEYVDS